ncbi:hypothetical protein MMC13_004584 [Lambiella insularis]|nr:hypothetical protein [Lambiella insularis]
MASKSLPPLYADSPLPLLETPKQKTGKTDGFTEEGSHMTISHNVMIRGYNSIIQQAPRLSAADHKDFIAYSMAWHRYVHDHHRYEETLLFPAIEEATGEKGVMDGQAEQHATFHDGLDRFKAYLLTLTGKEADFSASKLIEIMESFAKPLYDHLAAEPDAIQALARFETPEKPIDIVAIALETGKKVVNLDYTLNCLPMFMLNMEVEEFEGGQWSVFPPVPAPVLFIMCKVVPLWRRSVWRFAACDGNRRRKRLAV